jgi:hypothetical protein
MQSKDSRYDLKPMIGSQARSATIRVLPREGHE